jgi:hypothetical protein
VGLRRNPSSAIYFVASFSTLATYEKSSGMLISPEKSLTTCRAYLPGLHQAIDSPAPLAGCSKPAGFHGWDQLRDTGFRWVVNLIASEFEADVSPLKHLAAESLEDLVAGDAPLEPEKEEWMVRHVAGEIVEALKRGEGVLVHCHGGRGRTGTALGVVLCMLGHDPGGVVDWLDEVHRLRRRPGWPESPWQEEIVRRTVPPGQTIAIRRPQPGRTIP